VADAAFVCETSPPSPELPTRTETFAFVGDDCVASADAPLPLPPAFEPAGGPVAFPFPFPFAVAFEPASLPCATP
jgi:hypothetical protein